MVNDEKYKTTLNGHTVSYTLRRSTRARYSRLEISPENGLTVVIPVFGDQSHVQQLLDRKCRWILDKLAKYRPGIQRAARRVQDGDIVSYLGQNLRIEVRDGNSETVKLDGETLAVNVLPGENKLRSALEDWYRVEARKKIWQIADKWCVIMGLKYNRIMIKGQKTVWGSCSRKHNLNFNWRLIMAPEPVIDYVVIHELAHLKVMNHSKQFWKVVEKYCPDWSEHRKWLRIHSDELNRELRGQC
jgi:predicted metal-dependent hydrolase